MIKRDFQAMGCSGKGGTDHLPSSRQWSGSEWLWVVAVGLLACVLSSLPYMAGWLSQSPEYRYAWVAVQPDDILSYFAKMGQGQRGEWLFHLPYTAQSHAGVPVYTYYLLLGHISRWLSLSIPLVFHLARLAQGMILLLAAYVFIRRMTTAQAERRFIFLLVSFSSGLAQIPESNIFYTLMDNPHFALSQTLLLLLAAVYLLPPPASAKARALSTTAVEIGAVVLAAGLLGMLQPHMVVTALGIGVLYIGIQWWCERSVPLHLLVRFGFGAVTGLGVAGVIFLALNADPVLRAWQQQNQTPSPPVWYYLSGYVLLLIPAIWGAVWALRHEPAIGRLLVVWCLLTAVLIYAPTSLQRRLISGVHLPLAFLAGLGVCRVWTVRWSFARRWSWAYLLCTCVPTAMLVAHFTQLVVERDPDLFVTSAENRAMEWLQEHAPPDSIVLSSAGLGRFIPAFTPQRVVVGHWAETVNVAEVLPRVEHFYSPTAGPSQRCAAVRGWGVDYVLVGPRERGLGADPLSFSESSGFIQVAKFDDVAIHRVRCAPSPGMVDISPHSAYRKPAPMEARTQPKRSIDSAVMKDT